MSDISDIFQESLGVIGLESARYLGLPFSLRRKTLSFDIYNEVSRFFDGNLKFADKEISYFSVGEIENHEKVFNACVALVCLGNGEYIKPLLNYLDFPEPRWSIKIDFVINTILNERIVKFKILTYKEKVELQRKFISKHFYTNTKDLSDDLIGNRISFDFQKYFERIHRSKPRSKAFSMLDYSKHFEDELSCSEYFYTKSYNFLEQKKVEGLISWIDNSALENTVFFLNSCTSSIRDAIEDSIVSENSDFWIEKLKSTQANALTSIFIFQAISGKKGNRKLANRFVNEFISDSLTTNQVAAISDLFECTYRKQSISRVTNFLNNYESLSDQTRIHVDHISPVIRLYFKSHLANIYFSEKESLNLISYKPYEKTLFESFWATFKHTNKAFRKISKLKINSSWSLNKLTSDLKLLAILREKFEEESAKIEPEKLPEVYVRIFKSAVDESTSLSLSEGVKNSSNKI